MQLASHGALESSLEDAIEDWLDARTPPAPSGPPLLETVIESLRQMLAHRQS